MKCTNLKKKSNKIILKNNPGIKTNLSYKPNMNKYYFTDRYNKNNRMSFPNNFNACTINSSDTKNDFLKDLLKTESKKLSSRKSFNLNTNDEVNSNYISIKINESKINEENNNNNSKNKKK